jgi:hypothetical protein
MLLRQPHTRGLVSSAPIWKMTEGVGSSRPLAFHERLQMDAPNRSLPTIIPTNYLVWIGEWKLSWIVQQLGGRKPCSKDAGASKPTFTKAHWGCWRGIRKHAAGSPVPRGKASGALGLWTSGPLDLWGLWGLWGLWILRFGEDCLRGSPATDRAKLPAVLFGDLPKRLCPLGAVQGDRVDGDSRQSIGPQVPLP